MDATLRAILSELMSVSLELVRLRARIAELENPPPTDEVKED